MAMSRGPRSDSGIAAPGADAAPPDSRIAPLGPDAANHVLDALGKQVTTLRRSAGRTLAEVAGQSGLSTAYISQIESGSANPTLRTLAQLAAGLRCELGDLFGTGRSTTAATFAPRFTTRPPATNPPDAHEVWDITPLGATKLQTRLARGSAAEHATRTSHPGEELIAVLSGRCTVCVGGITRELGEGESCQFAASDSHEVNNVSENCVMLVVMSGD